MQIGLHIPDFTWTGGTPAFAAGLATLVRDAEDAGVARITVMDHFWQIPGVGPVDHDMHEAYTLLGYIAAHTQRVLLHTLVTGVTYREPALLVKAVTTLNVLSGGRAGLGIGAAWNADESAGLGFAFPPVKERFERLEEVIQICRQLWSDSQEPYEGHHYRLGRTLNAPQPLRQPYLMIGGGGEKRTLRLVAEYADACNLFATDEIAHKLDVLRSHCDAVGRDYDSVEKTVSLPLTPVDAVDDVVDRVNGLRELGFAVAYVGPRGIADPHRIVEVVGEVASRVA